MEVLIKAGQFLLGISILVVIHELGHFLAARAFGIKVDKFYLFFDVGGFKLFKIRRGETEYGIGWLPLGGYVKIVGMIDESMDKDFVQSEPKDYEFRSKPAWQRLIVMLGGIIMNVLLGVLVFFLHTWYYGETYVPAKELNNGIVAHSLAQKVGFQTGDVISKVNGVEVRKASDVFSNKLLVEKDVTFEVKRGNQTLPITLPDTFAATALNTGLDSFLEIRQSFAVAEVSAKSGAEKAGLKEGDSILAINGTPTPFFNDFSPLLAKYKNKTVDLTVSRGEGGQRAVKTLKAEVNEQGFLGFRPNVAVQQYAAGEAFSRGASKAWHAITDNVKGLWRLITGELPAQKSLHGLIGIANAYSPSWDWNSFWNLTALLSMVLAFMNLLPIPALDGGHVLFLLVEMVRRRPLSYKFLEVAQMVGMAVLFLLMGFALYNDFAQYIFK